MKILSVVYWLTTILVCIIFSYSAQMYLFNTKMVEGFFESFNYPTYIVIPLAVAKILGVIVLLWRKPPWLTEWSYAGFFFDLVLASTAHYVSQDESYLSVYFIPILFISYFSGKRVRPLYE